LVAVYKAKVKRREKSAMEIIESDYVDEALCKGLRVLDEYGSWQSSRAGDVLVAPWPIATANRRPMNRVSFSPLRDANPFFHLMEALWMLAGRNDADWLDQFVGDFSKRFAEERDSVTGKSVQHGAYGYRWRRHFDVEGGGEIGAPDQLDKAVELLRRNPEDRRVVIAMWDPVADLGKDKRDIPCNTHIYLRVQKEDPQKFGVDVNNPNPDGSDYQIMDAIDGRAVLDLTVCCRSNDAVWGAHGANAVHFSVLQEYLAARIGVGVGTLCQFSNNYHVYRPIYDKLWPTICEEGLGNSNWYAVGLPTPIVTVPESFDRDLALFFGKTWDSAYYHNEFFYRTAVPLRRSYVLWRAGAFEQARSIVHHTPVCDWTVAAQAWYDRRIHKQAAR
jgi:thymidylate synthase